jgi:hypothetical protein
MKMKSVFDISEKRAVYVPEISEAFYNSSKAFFEQIELDWTWCF